MPSQAAQPASTRGLALPEIVTSIMHQMDMRTLLTAQRVCHQWNHLIQTSHCLQQVLFLLPDDTRDPSEPRLYNPLLAEKFPSFFPPRDNDKSIDDTDLTSLAFIEDSNLLEIFLRPDASWRRMLTTQPPVRSVGEFSISSGMMGMTWTQKKAALIENGLQMGLLFETFISRDRWDWNGSMLWLMFGGPVAINAPISFKGWGDQYRMFDSDQAEMIRETDLVIGSKHHVDCTDPEGPDDPDYVKSDDELVWEKICAWYGNSGLSLSCLAMEEYHEGFHGWN